MGALRESDIERLVGTVGPLIQREFLRCGASAGELRRAVAIVASGQPATKRMSPRMHRLIDLIGAVETVPSADRAA